MTHLSQARVAALAAGEPTLDDDERQHLATCPACAAQIVALRDVVGAALAPPPSAPDVVDDIVRRVRAPMVPTPRPRLRLALVAAAAVVVVVVVALVGVAAGVVRVAPASTGPMRLVVEAVDSAGARRPLLDGDRLNDGDNLAISVLVVAAHAVPVAVVAVEDDGSSLERGAAGAVVGEERRHGGLVRGRRLAPPAVSARSR